MREYVDNHNQYAHPFTLTVDANLILGMVKRICERTSDSGH